MKPREKLESPTFYAKPKIFEQDVSHSVFKPKISFKMRHTLFSSRSFLGSRFQRLFTRKLHQCF